MPASIILGPRWLMWPGVFVELVGFRGIDVPKVNKVPQPSVVTVYDNSGHVADVYRKTGKLEVKDIRADINPVAKALRVNIENAVMKEMAINDHRPKLYGVAK